MKLKLIICILVLMIARTAFSAVKDLSKSDWSKILTEINAKPEESLLDRYVRSGDTLDKVNTQTKGSLKTDEWIKIFKKLNLEPKQEMQISEWELVFQKAGINYKSFSLGQNQQTPTQPNVEPAPVTPNQPAEVTSAATAPPVQNAEAMPPQQTEKPAAIPTNAPLKTEEQPYKPVKISLDLKGMDVLSVLKMISQKTELNIIAGNNVKGSVTIYLKEIDALDALKIILEMNDLAYVYETRVIKVMTGQDYEKVYGKKFYDRTTVEIVKINNGKAENVLKTLTQVKSKIAQVIADSASNSLIIIDTSDNINELKNIISTIDVKIETRVFPLNYTKAKDISDKLKTSLTPNISDMQIDERSNQLVITDTSKKLAEIAQLIPSLDKRHREVLIEAKIIQLIYSNAVNTGINWETVFTKINDQSISGRAVGNLGNLAAPQAISMGGENGVQLSVGALDTNNFKAVFDMLQSVGKTNLLATPRIAAIENKEARILVGTKEAYVTTQVTNPGSTVTNSIVAEAVNFVDVGMKLFVTPTIGDDSFITMKIRPELSSVDRILRTSQNNPIPIVRTSESETTVMVKDGITIIIAGLIEDKEIKKDEGIPLLCRIPILGIPFSRKSVSKEKSELIVFLTPHLITGETTSEEYIKRTKSK